MWDCIPVMEVRIELANYCLCYYQSISGDISISGGVELAVNSDFSPQFTLTCISTGGPATTVTWTRDSTTVTEGTETVLDDPETAQYTHTLIVTGRFGGIYTCTVANNKPSIASATITLQGIRVSIDSLCRNGVSSYMSAHKLPPNWPEIIKLSIKIILHCLLA